MLNILNCLLNHNDINKNLNALNIDVFNVYNNSVIIISADFSNHIQKIYKENASWASILKMLQKSDEKLNVDFMF